MANKKIYDLPASSSDQLYTSDLIELSSQDTNQIRRSKSTSLSNILQAFFSRFTVGSEHKTIERQIQDAKDNNVFTTLILGQEEQGGGYTYYRLYVDSQGNVKADKNSDVLFEREMQDFMATITRTDNHHYNYVYVAAEAERVHEEEQIPIEDINTMSELGHQMQTWADMPLPETRRSEWDAAREAFIAKYLPIRYTIGWDDPYTNQLRDFNSCKTARNSIYEYLTQHPGEPNLGTDYPQCAALYGTHVNRLGLYLEDENSPIGTVKKTFDDYDTAQTATNMAAIDVAMLEAEGLLNVIDGFENLLFKFLCQPTASDFGYNFYKDYYTYSIGIDLPDEEENATYHSLGETLKGNLDEALANIKTYVRDFTKTEHLPALQSSTRNCWTEVQNAYYDMEAIHPRPTV